MNNDIHKEKVSISLLAMAFIYPFVFVVIHDQSRGKKTSFLDRSKITSFETGQKTVFKTR